MNILMVYPTRLDNLEKPAKYKKAALPPLSLAILDRLTPERHSIKIVNDIAEDIDFSNSYDLVAITAMTLQITRAYQIADRFRNLGIKVIIGGFHATVFPQEVLEHADSVIVGEAENLWEQIIVDLENNRLKSFYQDTTFADLNRLIIPRWENMNMKIYPKQIGKKLPLMPIFTSRGCPYNCKFCSVTKFFGKTYRFKPVSHVIQEIKSTDSKDFFIIDDNIAGNTDYSKELFEALCSLDIHWFSQVSTTIFKNPDLIDLAAKAGCEWLYIGIESINNKSLNSVNKNFNKVDEYEEFFARLKKAGIVPYASIIFGLDHDTPDQFKLTLDFLNKNKVGFAAFFILTPLPGTEMFDEMKIEKRILTKNWAKYDGTNVVFQPKNLTQKELYENYWETYQKFLSLNNVFKRSFYNASISKHPFHEFLKSLFFQFSYRKKAYSFDHPFSGGIDRVN